MRACWEGLHVGLRRSVCTLKTKNDFRKIRKDYFLLLQFDDPIGLVDFLNAKTGDLNEKDLVYEILVKIIQTKGPAAETASTILWLGLWPGLDALYRRRLKHFLDDPEELASSISAALTALIERMDLSEVRRLASTIVRSTERDAMEGRQRRWREEESRSDKENAGDALWGHLIEIPRESVLGILTNFSTEAEIVSIRGCLLPIIGEDTDLVLAILFFGNSQKEAGEALGISHDAARKRYQRALDRIRENLTQPLSQSEESNRVSTSETARPKGERR